MSKFFVSSELWDPRKVPPRCQMKHAIRVPVSMEQSLAIYFKFVKVYTCEDCLRDCPNIIPIVEAESPSISGPSRTAPEDVRPQ